MSPRDWQRAAIDIDRLAARLATLGAAVAAVFLVLMILHILLEVTIRSAFSISTYALDEYVGYGVAAINFLAAGYALQEGALIRVNLLL